MTSALVTGSPLAVSVPVALNDTAAQWAAKVRAALADNGSVSRSILKSFLIHDLLFSQAICLFRGERTCCWFFPGGCGGHPPGKSTGPSGTCVPLVTNRGTCVPLVTNKQQGLPRTSNTQERGLLHFDVRCWMFDVERS